MINYQQIANDFGAPLNTVPRPNVPFKWKTWHFVAIGIGVYILYKGIRKIKEDFDDFKDGKKS